MRETEFELGNDLDLTAAKERRLETELSSAAGLATGVEWEISPVYPRPERQTVRGFSRYSNAVPPAERSKLRNIARLIVQSFGTGKRPIRIVRVVGHADRDLARERREPGYMTKISRERALAVTQELQRLINNEAISRRIRWHLSGAGASRMVVPYPRNEPERAKNRRVEISLPAEGDCSGWERDPQSFSKRAVEHYLKGVWQPSFRVQSITCSVPPPDWICKVTVNAGAGLIILTVKLSPGDKLVGVQRIPDPKKHMSCFYSYRCLPSGALVLEDRPCPTF